MKTNQSERCWPCLTYPWPHLLAQSGSHLHVLTSLKNFLLYYGLSSVKKEMS